MKKWIFSSVLALLTLSAAASTTKVGNGDDGVDLEGAQPITSGIIYETRKEAILAIKALNLHGVAGLGGLLPELENTQLILAKADVHPIGTDGAWETSPEQKLVYARTFAEPYAPTLFFPAALKLSREQLIALHTHEALHRSLPSGTREDEDKVAYLTMAITSPSASFDRVSRVANSVLSQANANSSVASSSTSVGNRVELPKRDPSKMELALAYLGAYQARRYDNTSRNLIKGSGEVSVLGVHHVDRTPFESILNVAGFVDTRGKKTQLGSVSFTSRTPFYLTEKTTAGPYLQYNMKPLDPQPWLDLERDVYTVGAFVDTEMPNTYSRILVTYTLPSSYKRGPGYYDVSNGGYELFEEEKLIRVSEIWSIRAHEGFKLKKFDLGLGLELHRGQGFGKIDDFVIFRAGPEAKWSNGVVTASLAIALTVNSTEVSLTDLGDVPGHGTGRDSMNFALAYAF